MYYRHKTLFFSLLSFFFLITGCVSEDGESWGEISILLSVDSELDSRIQEDQLRTAQDYMISLERFDVTIDVVKVNLAADTALNFDPADPPEGYSLCHNGHCHADDGSLVDYEDISLELSGNSGGITIEIGREISLDSFESAIVCEQNSCQNESFQSRGSLSSVSILVDVAISGRAFDAPNVPERVALEGVPFAVQLENVEIITPISGEIGPNALPKILLIMDLVLPANVFDDIDFSDQNSITFIENITERIAQSAIEVEIERKIL